MDYYKTLNIKEDANLKDIEQAYKDLSSFYNPNNNVSKLAYQKYREIEKAYKILKEEKQREIYTLSIRNVKAENNLVKDTKANLTIEDFYSLSKSGMNDSEYIDIVVEEPYAHYLHLTYDIDYLYYLVGSEYKISFNSRKIISSKGVCKHCLGMGKVRENNKIVYCKECLATGKEIETKNELVELYVKVENRIILDDYKVVINFNFIDKDNYLVTGNDITYKKRINEDEYYNGIHYHLKKDDNILDINYIDFNDNLKTYIFLDKVIHLEFILDSYRGKDIKGYVLTTSEVIYLNPKDYTYSLTPSDICNYKIELHDSSTIVENMGLKGFNDKNGDLLIEVLRIENNDVLQVFFNRKIKKVSSRLFKFNGEYNNHKFSNGKNFEYDDNYLYIPSLAYKLTLKHFTLFKIVLPLIFVLLPIINLLIFGFGYIFFIMSCITLILSCVAINLIMEVKI